jgi:hypothetical protein
VADLPALRAAAIATEAWLDLLLLLTTMALAPYEWGARFAIHCAGALGKIR